MNNTLSWTSYSHIPEGEPHPEFAIPSKQRMIPNFVFILTLTSYVTDYRANLIYYIYLKVEITGYRFHL